MTDKKIMELYMAGDEAAIAETRERYGRYCRYIAEHIVGDEWIAEEIENDVLLKAWNTIPAEKPASLRSYLGMLSRQLAINRQAAESAKGRGGGEYVMGRSGHCPRNPGEIGIHAVRVGNIVGEHEVIIGTDTQTITLKHQVYDRALLAEGAIAAAIFLKDQPAGLYNMQDMLKF